MAKRLKQWTVHPNRSAIGPDEPGRNGHFRSVSRPPYRPKAGDCLARVGLPPELSHAADTDGSVTFAGSDWRWVVGAARSFAGQYVDVELPPPFGFRDRGRWWWWDGTSSEESRLDGPDAERYVEEFLERLFPGLPITLTDLRNPAASTGEA